MRPYHRHGEEAAFLIGSRRDDALAQELAEEVIEKMTSGEDSGIELRDAFNEEEIGGPFVTTTWGQEVADDIDASNPRGSLREPFPRT